MDKYSPRLGRASYASEDVVARSSGRTRLHNAVEDIDLALVKPLLRSGANVNARDIDGRSPMHMVARLLTFEDEECFNISPTFEIEDEEARAEIIKLLLTAGADPNARDLKKDTPLSLAYRYDRPCCVRVLIEAGADPSIYREDRGTATPVFVVDLIRNPNGAQVVASMLATGAGVNEKDSRGHTLLDRAAFCGSPSAVRALLDAGADPRAETDRPPLRSVAMLMKSDGGEEAAMALVKAGAVVDGRVYEHAIEYHSWAAIRLLLDAGANPNLLVLGRTLLCYAIDCAKDDDDHDMIRALLQGGADVNGLKHDENRPLHLASKRGHVSTVRLLLESGADPHLRDGWGQTALEMARCTATITVLLEAEVDPNARGNGCWPPLHLAAQSHQPPRIIQLLLKAGADLRIRGPGGRTALHLALEAPGCTDKLLSVFLDAGADLNAKDDGGETPLHYAVQYQCPSSTTLLLKSRADPHARDLHGRTPLFCAMFAAERSDDWVQHVAALRDVGANIDDPDDNGITPLSYALSRQSVRTACSLLRLGADPRAGHANVPISPGFIIDLIGKTSMDAIVAIVTRGCLRSDGVNSEEAPHNFPWDLSESDKGEYKLLVSTLRERMLEQPSSGRKGFIEMLSTLYGMLDWYPPDPALHECEVALPQGRPSHFGGFADCWKGLFLGRHEVAMKTFRGSLAEEAGARRLVREAKVWSHLHHPNVLPFLGLCTLGSVPYLISPWMENGHALGFVQKQPDTNRLRLLVQVASGLDYLHSFKPGPVIHGDLRGANILISPSSDACIADFGLSELKNEIYESYSTTFITAGNPRWQAPEILGAGSKEAARRNTTTDMFAFGRVMLELFTADVPFSYIPEAITVTIMVMRGELPQRPCDDEVRARGLDDGVWQLMTDCWHATPSERPRTADLVTRLTQAKSTSEPSSSKTEPSLEIAPGESAHIHAESLTAHPLVRPGEAKSSPTEKESSTVEEDPTNEREPSPRPRKRLRASD